ncbi:MAG: response regulator transcription factor [Pleurocapsa sp.]
MITLVVANAQQPMINNLALHFERVPDISLISWAGNGIEAIKSVEKHQPNVVLMDLNLPVMNGIEASMIITHRFPHTKVVLLTNQNNRQILSLALEAGAKSLIFNNIRSNDIEEIIRLVTKGFYQFGPILGECNQIKSLAILSNNDVTKIVSGINEIKQNIALNQEQITKVIKR